ncbi:MAG TPA: response regulator [Opitutaceae bacterium]|nr:response regulator [Opitutaceae bacterium]
MEDSLRDSELIHAHIGEEWPDVRIKRVETRREFLGALQHEAFDLILSDFTLPEFNGLEALILAREYCASTPFVFLSGTIGEDNAVIALQNGAADYVMKDRQARLIPAIRAALTQRREQRLRKLAEQRLLEQAEVLDKARDAICVTDMHGHVTYWNQSAGGLFGLDGEEDREIRLQDLFGVSNQALIPDALKELLLHGSWTGEIRIVRWDGSHHHVVSRWTLVRDDSGHPKSILLINTDVTEQKQLEAQLLRSQRLEGLGTLAGGIAHDLNNVLAPILMSVDMLRKRTTDEGTLQLVSVLEKNALHGTNLIRQVLAFARGAEGERTEVQPKLVINDVVAMLKGTVPRLVQIETILAPDLWTVVANPTQLGQVLMNLAVNARDAMPGRGRLLLEARNVIVDARLIQGNPGARSGPHVLFIVADTGVGMPPELLNRIFDPFFTTKDASKGTGLGLPTVLGIIKSHGGFLEVQSEPGRGTEFRLYFPAVVTEPEPPEGAGSTSLPQGDGEMILVIDDEPSLREITGEVLVANGYRVLTAEDGPTGLAVYREHQGEIRAVLTDMMMPGMQGEDVIRELLLTSPDVRIVAMSGVTLKHTGLVENPGKFAFLPKPMTAMRLLGAIQSVLDSPAPRESA